MPGQYQLEIIDHRQVAPGHFELTLPQQGELARAEPGQFVSVLVRAPESFDPLLRRPLSIYRTAEDRFSLLYRVVGRGTRRLSQFRAGEALDCVGPLGRGFTYRDLSPGAKVVLVGGGVGVPPLVFLSQKLLQIGIVPEVFAGYASSEHVVGLGAWREAGLEPVVSTDDGSLGYRGYVTQVFAERLAQGSVERVYACGPRPMLAEVAALAGRYGVDCQVAMEEWMACGIGVCLSCVTKVQEGGANRWVRVCREGPVFDARKVVWQGGS